MSLTWRGYSTATCTNNNDCKRQGIDNPLRRRWL